MTLSLHSIVLQHPRTTADLPCTTPIYTCCPVSDGRGF